MNHLSDGISGGVNHPERPLPTAEVVFAADEYVNGHLQWAHAPVQEGVDDVMALADRRADFVGDRTNLDTTVTRVLVDAWDDARNQVNATKVFEKIALGAGARLVLLTGVDLYTRNSNFVFGVTGRDEETGLALISAFRFQELPEGVRERTLKHVAKHEFGHLIGLDEKRIRNQDARDGTYTGHCVNECVMQQMSSLREALNQVRELDGAPNHGFCSDCTEAVSSILGPQS